MPNEAITTTHKRWRRDILIWWHFVWRRVQFSLSTRGDTWQMSGMKSCSSFSHNMGYFLSRLPRYFRTKELCCQQQQQQQTRLKAIFCWGWSDIAFVLVARLLEEGGFHYQHQQPKNKDTCVFLKCRIITFLVLVFFVGRKWPLFKRSLSLWQSLF